MRFVRWLRAAYTYNVAGGAAQWQQTAADMRAFNAARHAPGNGGTHTDRAQARPRRTP